MKLKETFIIHESGDEAMLIPTGTENFSGMVRGNRTMGMILNLLKKACTEESLIEGMKKEYPDAPAEAIEQDVKRALGELRKIGALDE